MDGQVSMFDMGTTEEQEQMQKQKYSFEIRNEIPEKEMLSMEKEMLGIYISGHPLEKYKKQIQIQTNISTLDLRQIDEQMSVQMEQESAEKIMNMPNVERPKFCDGQKIKFAGIITSIKKKYTKNNKIMAFVTIEDLYGTAEIIVFETAYMNSKDALVEENIVLVDGRLSIKEDDSTTIIANVIKNFSEQKHNVLVFDITGLEEDKKAQLRAGIKYFTGDRNNMNVFVKVGEEEKSCGAIYVNENVLDIFKKILGDERVSLKLT